MIDGSITIATAEGFLALEEYEEAWEYIESVPASQRMHPALLRVRVLCAMALVKLEMAETLAIYLAEGPREYAQFAAGILHELAVAHYLGEDAPHARELIKQAILTWPDERLSILDDPTLKDLF